MTTKLSQYYYLIAIGLCILLATTKSFGQQYFFKNFSVEQGLSQSEVGDIVQDRSGRLFLRTVSSGIDVFDGEHFSKITKKDGLLNSFVNKIHQDHNGQIWFASSDGLSMYRKDSILSYRFNESIGKIESIFSMHDSQTYGLLLSTNRGLVQFKQGQFVLLSSRKLRVFSMINFHNDLLLGTDSGLYQYKDGNLINRTELISNNHQILAMVTDQNGRLYCGTQNGVFQLYEQNVDFIPIDISPNNSVISALSTYDNKVIFGTNGDGLVIFHPDGRREYIDESMGLSDNYIWSLLEDKEHNIWIGTSGAGIDLYSEDQFRIFTTKNGLQNDIVYDIIEDDIGRIWFGIVQGGISIFDGEKIENFSEKDGLSHRTVRCFHKEGERIYIGTENGLSIYEKGIFRDASDEFGLRDNAIFDIHRSKDSTLWFACKGERYYGPNGGVFAFKNGKRKAFKKKDGLGSENVFHIFEKSNGEIWFGTDDGIYKYESGSFSRLGKGFVGECSNTIISMAEDHLGNCWIGTIGGLAYFDGTSFTCFQDEKVSAGKSIFFLTIQEDQNLWIGSSDGLEKLDLNTFYKERRLKTIIYNDQNGFYGSECNQNAVYTDSKGNMWFGTIKAAIKYSPEKEDTTSVKPDIELTTISLSGKQTSWKELGFKLDSLSGVPSNLRLNYNQNDLLIEYQGIYLKNPEALTYQFKLEGLAQDAWSEFTDQKSIYFSNLLPGDYSFQVNVLNKDTGLSQLSPPFNFSIQPAFWQTNVFKVIGFLFLLILVYFIIQIRTNNVRSKEKIKQDFQTQLHEVEMKALRAQMNPHFIFNSLNSINHFIIKNKKELASEYLTKFSRLIRLVLQNSKEKLVTLEEELNALTLYVELEALRFQNKFDYQVNSNVNSAFYRIPPLLLQPFVENAIWHGLLHLKERKGRLTMDIEEKDAQLEIRIVDNGIGRVKSKEMKSKNAIKKKSMGLKINSERLQLAEVLYNSTTSLEIKDLKNVKGDSEGTEVVIKIKYN
ncbi:MAG: two-component regulator propeller domain-containing protein [Bacteroidota bacterium]